MYILIRGLIFCNTVFYLWESMPVKEKVWGCKVDFSFFIKIKNIACRRLWKGCWVDIE